MYKSQHIITSRHYLVLCVASFVFGIFIAAQLGFGKAIMLTLVAALTLFAIFILFLLLTRKRLKTKFILFTIILVISVICGIFRLYAAESPEFNRLASYKNREAWVIGTVSSEPRLLENSHSFSFELNVSQINDDRSAKGTVIMYISQSRGCNVHFGDTVRCWTRLTGDPEHSDGPGDDYYTRLKSRNIFLLGRTKNINLLNDNYAKSLKWTLTSTGNFVKEKICTATDVSLSQLPQNAAILKGILIGDKTDFDTSLYDKLANSGLSHIVAVSGLHISILFSFLVLIMSGLNIRNRFRLLFIIPFIVLFMAASSFTPSVCRASAMIIIMIFASLTGEDYDPITSLAFALGCILLSNPYALFSKSLVLSFSATLGIFIYFGYLNSSFLYIIRKHDPYIKAPMWKTALVKGYKTLSASLSLSFASFLGTAYFLAVFFGRISIVQFLTNLWVVPTVFVVFCLGYVSCLTYYLCPWLAITVLRPVLNIFLEIISRTADIFGLDIYAFEIDSKALSGIHAIVYFGCAYMVYMTFKAIHDIKVEKRLRIEKGKIPDNL